MSATRPYSDDKSTFVKVLAWCRQATSHQLSQCWPRFVSPNGVTRPQLSHCGLVMHVASWLLVNIDLPPGNRLSESVLTTHSIRFQCNFVSNAKRFIPEKTYAICKFHFALTYLLFDLSLQTFAYGSIVCSRDRCKTMQRFDRQEQSCSESKFQSNLNCKAKNGPKPPCRWVSARKT